MKSSEANHPVHQNNPIELKGYVDRPVKLETVDGTIHEGICYTIDPVSESVVLINKGDVTSMKIIFHHAVKSITILGDLNPLNPFKCEKLSHENNLNARLKLMEWLTSNMIPVEQKGENIEFGGQLTIVPPYTKDDCLSSNEIILKKIQDLIESMPH